MSATSPHLQRLTDLEGIRKTVYERLSEFQKRMVATADVAQRFDLRQRIRDEVIPDIRKYDTEYAELLADATHIEALPPNESETVCVEIVEAVKSVQSTAKSRAPRKIVALLNEIEKRLSEPGKSAAAKLKVSLPIIPLLVAYELELDTESLITKAWRRIGSLFSKELPPPP